MLSLSSWWYTVEIANRSRTPIDHCSNLLMKAAGSFKTFRERDGGQRTTRAPVTIFACDKVFEFQDEWDLLLDGADGAVAWDLLGRISDDEVRAEYTQLAAFMCCNLSAEFTRRLSNKMQMFPYLLFWLVWQPHSVICSDRRACCRDMLSTPEGQLGQTASAMLKIWLKEIQDAANTGLLDLDLWELIWDLASIWALETQELEGLNNIIRYVTKLAPNVRWATMVNRVMARKLLVGYRGNIALQSDQVANCVAHHEAAKQFAAEGGRYELSEQELAGVPDQGDKDDDAQQESEDPDAAADEEGQGDAPDVAAAVRPVIRDEPQKCVMTLLAALKAIYKAKTDDKLKPCFDYGFVVTWRNHVNSFVDDGEPEWQMILLSDQYRRRLWATEASEIADESTHLCVLNLPLTHRPLWISLRTWHRRLLEARSEVAFGDLTGPNVDIAFAKLKWDRYSTHGCQAATIVEAEHWLSMSFACRSAEPPRQGPPGADEDRPARDTRQRLSAHQLRLKSSASQAVSLWHACRLVLFSKASNTETSTRAKGTWSTRSCSRKTCRCATLIKASA